MRTLHVHWFDKAEKPAATLARAFHFDMIPLKEREVLWVKIMAGLVGGTMEHKEGARAVDQLLPNFQRHRVEYRQEDQTFAFRTYGGVQVKLTAQDHDVVMLDVDFKRDSLHYALSLAGRLVARPVVLAIAAAQRASCRHSGPWVEVVHDPDATKCNRCGVPLCT